jgi:mRNA degradation ribonuclease J1/J2
MHASGHASSTDLLEITREVKPEILLPVHSLEPDFYAKNLSQSKIEVILPNLGETMAI